MLPPFSWADKKLRLAYQALVISIKTLESLFLKSEFNAFDISGVRPVFFAEGSQGGF